MRRTSKARAAGSTKRMRAGRKPALLLVSVAACVAALVVVVGPASGATTRFLVEVFGSAAQPTFPADRGMAVDQATGELYVLEVNSDEIRRYNADGTPSNFAALGSNVIDGEGAGDETPDVGLDFPSSRSESQIAIDESGGATDGNVYVVERARDQVSIFDSEGNYLGELSEHSGGAFNEPLGVAVDPSGNVYVGDFSSADEVHKYEPAANPPVNGDNTASFNSLAGTSSPGTLAAGAGATAGFIFVNRFNGELFKLDATTGELKYQIATSASTVYVDPGTGHVFVPRLTGSSSEVVEYDASGASEATKVSAFKPGSTVEGTAVNSASEEVYVSRSGTENVEVFGPAAVVPDVVTSPPSSNTGTRATLAGTVNPDGVELDECFFEWTQSSNVSVSSYDNVIPCNLTPAEIGAGTTPVAVEAELTGLAPQGTRYHYRLVAVNPNVTVNGSNRAFETANTVIALAASGVTDTEATLNGTVNPDTEPISECVFEWGEEKGPFDDVQEYPEAAPCVPGPAGIGTGESPVAVEAGLSGLHPGTAYVYRLKAAYPTGPATGDTETVQTAGPRIADSWAEDVLYTEAILKAEIDPEGTATTYRFEWGPTTAYGNETEELNVGSDSSVHTLSRFLDDLTPGTEYHWRVVATSAAGENEGPDHVIRTFRRFEADTDCPNQVNRYGAGASLPDCRAYEMVSPLDKANADVFKVFNASLAVPARVTKSTPSGNKLTYSSQRAFGDSEGAPFTSQYIAQRHSGGQWATHSLNYLRTKPIYAAIAASRSEYQYFTDDLCQAWARPGSDPPLSLGGVAGYPNLYRRDDRLCGPEGFTALAPLSAPAGNPASSFFQFEGTSADGSRAIFTFNRKLLPEATEGEHQLYESFEEGGAAQLRFVCVLPGGAIFTADCQAGAGEQSTPQENRDILTGAISDDGERIFWTPALGAEQPIYVRIGGTETRPVSEEGEKEAGTGGSWFWGASRDGARVIYTTGTPTPPNRARLYAFDVDEEETELIAAGGVYGVLGMSEDKQQVYFASDRVLPGSGQNVEGEEALDGQPNLYLYDADSGTSFIATLAAQDVALAPGRGIVGRSTVNRAARVTADGARLAFESHAPLTGYDNRDVVGGSIRPQVFLYDVSSEALVCASCNPSGARDRQAFGESEVRSRLPFAENSLHFRNPLSEDGSRVFFNSISALTPRDSNGRVDVYQWEAVGTGRCDAGDWDFAAGAGGCISLLSSGTSDRDAEFAEATPSGDDVFIATLSSLVPQDYGLIDIYDARVGGGSPPPPEPPDCFGDACQGIPNPPDDPTPASAGFRGAGDPIPTRNCGAAGRRAAKLSRRAKRLRRAARRSSSPKRSKRMRRKSARFAKRAKRLSGNAKRCRRANRRASR